jgi:putative ABC transport system permease protein
MATEPVHVAFQALRLNPLRTLLSTLGVVIGVGALVSIFSLADGMEAFSRAEIEATTDLHAIGVSSITTDRVDGLVLRRRDFPIFIPTDAAELERELAGRAVVGLSTLYAGFWRPAPDTAEHQAAINAMTSAALAIQDPILIAGRLLNPADMAGDSAVAVVSQSVARRAAPSTGVAVGRQIIVGGAAYRVVGVVEGPARGEAVDRITIPLLPPERLPGAVDARPPSLVIRARRVEDVPALRAETESWLAGRWDGAAEKFAVSSNVGRVAQAQRAMLVFKLVMGTIAGISLVVGGIGIMNVLLASIVERTREIGIRRASGARRRDIWRQFLAESVAISAVGSGLGVAAGMLVSIAAVAVIRRYAEAELHTVFAWQSIAFAVAAALAIGIIFGMYPALRASRLSPIDALRHE